MECADSVCELQAQIGFRDCRAESTWFVFRNLDVTTGYTQVQIATTDLCLENVDDERLELRTCVDSDLRQKYLAGDGSFAGDKFELQTVINTNSCLASDHHPRSTEIIFQNRCRRARNSHASFWNKY